MRVAYICSDWTGSKVLARVDREALDGPPHPGNSEESIVLVIPFTDEDIAQLRYLRLNYPHPRVRQKIDAVYLKALGYPHHEIARFLNVTETTVRSYLKEYAEGGLDAVLRFEVGGSVSALEPHRTSITEEFERNPPASAREAAARIESLTGLHRSPSQVRVLLKHLGLKYRKVAPIPAKADPAAQERFLSEQLDPILAQAQAGLVHVFFMDALFRAPHKASNVERMVM